MADKERKAYRDEQVNKLLRERKPEKVEKPVSKKSARKEE